MIVGIAVLNGCRKSDNGSFSQHTVIDSSLFNPPSYKLKTHVEQGSPSPNYLFEYDADGKVSRLNSRGGDLQYECFYSGKALTKMVNQNFLARKDTIHYSYDNGLVKNVAIAAEGLGTVAKLAFEYDNKKRLQLVTWDKLENNNWNPYRKLSFQYNNDDNLFLYKNYMDVGSGLNLLDSMVFENYDQQVNPRVNFVMVTGINEHFIYLPYIKLQKNNSLKETVKRGQNVFITQHNYTYQNNLPLVDNKTITIHALTSMQIGSFAGLEQFTYQ